MECSIFRTKVDLTKYEEEYQFNFDAAFDEHTTNQQLYLAVVRPIVEAAFNRARVTCFAYGQTGSGKTYTMLGDYNDRVPGLYLLAAYDIFCLLNNVILLMNRRNNINTYPSHCPSMRYIVASYLISSMNELYFNLERMRKAMSTQWDYKNEKWDQWNKS